MRLRKVSFFGLNPAKLAYSGTSTPSSNGWNTTAAANGIDGMSDRKLSQSGSFPIFQRIAEISRWPWSAPHNRQDAGILKCRV